MQKLSNKKIEKLIVLVKLKPALYDKKERGYSKIDRRDKTWLDIAATLNADVKDCKTAWRSLRDQFQKSLKEIKGSTGQAAAESMRKKYKYFDELLFLKDSIELKETHFNYDVKEETPIEIVTNESDDDFLSLLHNAVVSDQPENEEKGDPIAISTCSNDSSSSPPLPISRPSSSHEKRAAKRGKKRKHNTDGSEYGDLLKELLSQCKQGNVDGVDHFFLGISSTVKKYELSASEVARLQCNTMLFVTGELEKINSMSN